MAERKRVFVSYSSKDTNLVNDIVELLRQLGISHWKAPEMIPVGSNYAREIPKAIKECEVFLLILSEASQVSIWIEKEIDMAVNCRKTIVPVKIDNTPLNDLYSFYLNNVQMIPYSENADRGRRMLKERLLRLLPKEEAKEEKQEEITAGQHSGQKEAGRKKSIHKVDVFSKNPAPSHCQFCGGGLKKIGVGVYECKACGRENYDYLRRVRNYLEQNGSRSAVLIAQETGVPRDSVEHFLREEFLEIPKYAAGRISCSRCGAPIRTGTLCDKCKEAEEMQSVSAPKERWYSTRKR